MGIVLTTEAQYRDIRRWIRRERYHGGYDVIPKKGTSRTVADIGVTSDTILSIEPETTVEITERVSLEENGSLHVTGTPAGPVRFTSPRRPPTPGSGASIEMVGSSGSHLFAHEI